MKKKIGMRVVSLALCVIFTGMLFGAPKSKAVVTETAIGTAAVASYFQATGLTLAASSGATGALVTSGIADIAGSYALATGAASSGSTFLSSLAAGVSISPAGAIVLTAAAVVAIGALVAWYVAENGLEEEGATVTVLPGTSDSYLYNGAELPALPVISDSYFFIFLEDGQFQLFSCSVAPVWSSIDFVSFSAATSLYLVSGNTWEFSYTWESGISVDTRNKSDFWCNVDILSTDGTLFLASSDPVSSADPLLSVSRGLDFVQPDTALDLESPKEMVIDAGFAAGTTLDTVAEQVPELIAAGTLAPTYEITTTETGEGTDTETDPDEETGIYIPILSDIKTALSNLGTSVVDGIMSGLESLFVPSEAYLEALPQQITDTFEERTGFLTYPFSLLPEFVDRLSSTSQDWILSWPQIVEPFTNTVLFHQGSWNVSAFMRNNATLADLYELYRLLAKVFMSFGFLALCYNKYCSVVGDDYGGL